MRELGSFGGHGPHTATARGQCQRQRRQGRKRKKSHANGTRRHATLFQRPAGEPGQPPVPRRTSYCTRTARPRITVVAEPTAPSEVSAPVARFTRYSVDCVPPAGTSAATGRPFSPPPMSKEPPMLNVVPALNEPTVVSAPPIDVCRTSVLEAVSSSYCVLVVAPAYGFENALATICGVP